MCDAFYAAFIVVRFRFRVEMKTIHPHRRDDTLRKLHREAISPPMPSCWLLLLMVMGEVLVTQINFYCNLDNFIPYEF